MDTQTLEDAPAVELLAALVRGLEQAEKDRDRDRVGVMTNAFQLLFPAEAKERAAAKMAALHADMVAALVKAEKEHDRHRVGVMTQALELLFGADVLEEA